jgi:hypothetical protein
VSSRQRGCGSHRRGSGCFGSVVVVSSDEGPGLEVDDAVLAPLVLLHGLLPVELLVADVALERPVVAMGALVNLKIEPKT